MYYVITHHRAVHTWPCALQSCWPVQYENECMSRKQSSIILLLPICFNQKIHLFNWIYILNSKTQCVHELISHKCAAFSKTWRRFIEFVRILDNTLHFSTSMNATLLQTWAQKNLGNPTYFSCPHRILAWFKWLTVMSNSVGAFWTLKGHIQPAYGFALFSQCLELSQNSTNESIKPPNDNFWWILTKIVQL